MWALGFRGDFRQLWWTKSCHVDINNASLSRNAEFLCVTQILRLITDIVSVETDCITNNSVTQVLIEFLLQRRIETKYLRFIKEMWNSLNIINLSIIWLILVSLIYRFSFVWWCKCGGGRSHNWGLITNMFILCSETNESQILRSLKANLISLSFVSKEKNFILTEVSLLGLLCINRKNTSRKIEHSE